ncbi:hypothetical protein ACF07W_31140 [Streptomyces sp. NPDC015140]
MHVPLIRTYVLDPAANSYQPGDMSTGIVSVAVPFAVEIGLGRI